MTYENSSAWQDIFILRIFLDQDDLKATMLFFLGSFYEVIAITMLALSNNFSKYKKSSPSPAFFETMKHSILR